MTYLWAAYIAGWLTIIVYGGILWLRSRQIAAEQQTATELQGEPR